MDRSNRIEIYLQRLPARTKPVIQLALHDCQIANRTILSFSDSIREHAAP